MRTRTSDVWDPKSKARRTGRMGVWTVWTLGPQVCGGVWGSRVCVETEGGGREVLGGSEKYRVEVLKRGCSVHVREGHDESRACFLV